MKRFLFMAVCLLLLAACSVKTELPSITSVRFTPLNFPYGDFGEFTLSESQHKEQLDLFLRVFTETFQSGTPVNLALQEYPNTFALQLFSTQKLIQIYRLTFTDENAYLQNNEHVFRVADRHFNEIMETGYFNVIFQKNHAPTALFEWKEAVVPYSVDGIWNYTTFQNKVLSYKINKQERLRPILITGEEDAGMTFSFQDKKPDFIFRTALPVGQTNASKTLLTSDTIPMPKEEGEYTIRIEAKWSNPDLPYHATLQYQFPVVVDYLPKINLSSSATQGNSLLLTVENFDPGGSIIITSALWEREIIPAMINRKYYALLPIGGEVEPGDYEITISGKNSKEVLNEKRTLTVKKTYSPIRQLSYLKGTAMQNTILQRDEYLRGIVQKYAFLSSEEKLWWKAFLAPCEIIPLDSFHQISKYRDWEYHHDLTTYVSPDPIRILAVANGIVRIVEEREDYGKTILIDHGMGVFSLYHGFMDASPAEGSYLYSGQMMGESFRRDKLHSLSFGLLLHGQFINPQYFYRTDPFSLSTLDND